MASNTEISLRLELIAAKAAQLAHDVKARKLWDGDLQRGLSEIREQLDAASSAARNTR